jgi:transcriptional regulator with XRE-family HTH domain
MTSSDLRAAVGAAIRAIRTGQSIPQERLAALAGVDRAFMGRLERGETNPSVETLAKVADALGTPLDVLFAEVERLRGE